MGRSRSRRGRDRNRDGGGNRRSRSEESAERSREREKRRRRQQREFMQKHGGKGKGRGGDGGDREKPSGGGGGVVVAQGTAAPAGGRQGMFWDGFQWIPTEQTQSTAAQTAVRKMKRLYVGNLPDEPSARVNEEQFREILIANLREKEILENDRTSEGLDLLIWIHQEQGYGFVELETVEMAEKTLVKLDGMLVNGYPIQFKRPTDQSVNKMAIPGVANMLQGNHVPLALTAPAICSSRVLLIGDCLVYDPFKTEGEDFADTLEDMVDGCSQHGKLNSVNNRIIKPEHMDQLIQNDIHDLQIGNVFLEFMSIGDASSVMNKMQARKYDGRFLKFICYPEERFYQHIVTLPA